MYNDPKRQFNKVLFGGGFPATMILIAVNVVTWIMSTTMGAGSPATYLAFVSRDWPIPAFWTAITWPLVAAGHPLSVLFSLLMAYFVCGSLERSWGTRRFTLFFFALALLTAATTWIGGRLLGLPVFFAGLWHALAAPTVAWAFLNTREKVGLYFGIVQVPALVFAGLGALILWYEVGAPFLGLFALSGCVAAWWYVTQGRNSFARGEESNRIHESAKSFRPNPPEQVSAAGFDPMRWWKERQERRRLEDIMRRSGFTDDDR